MACLAPATVDRVAGEAARATVCCGVKSFSAFFEKGTSAVFCTKHRTILIRRGDRDAHGKKDQDISKWDTRRVTTISGTFFSASAFNHQNTTKTRFEVFFFEIAFLSFF
jgi:hypothetical protein